VTLLFRLADNGFTVRVDGDNNLHGSPKDKISDEDVRMVFELAQEIKWLVREKGFEVNKRDRETDKIAPVVAGVDPSGVRPDDRTGQPGDCIEDGDREKAGESSCSDDIKAA
jgi:hypothetical protein